MPRRRLVGALCALAVLIPAAPARAVIEDARTIDGPSGSVIDLGGVAMAEDGTGGLVYRRSEGGRTRIYAAQFVDGRWQAPQRVDVGQGFDSSWPRIAAGSGGRLVVVWVQEFGPSSDRLYSAALDPDARRFQGPVPVDFNVGEATATYPSVAMNRAGQAYLSYRVVTQDQNLPPGYVMAQTRVARYSGSLWTVLGSPANRNPASPVRNPTAANSPKLAVGLDGNALIAFQEPDDEFVDRIWARRIFGTSYGVSLLVSPQKWDDAPLRGPADAFDVSVGGFGQGAVAFRQQPGSGSRLGGTRMMVNLIPEGPVEGADKFTGASTADGDGAGGAGEPTVSVTGPSRYMLGYSIGGAAIATEGDDGGVGQPARLDGGGNAGSADPVVLLAESRAAAGAWKERIGGRGSVAVLERTADGIPETRSVRATAGGEVTALMADGSGLGDALVAFQQGGGGSAQIAAAVVNAPPVDVLLDAPEGYIRRSRTRINWAPAANAIGTVRYSVAVDDETVEGPTSALSAVLGRGSLPEGTHRLEVVAEDSAGQETLSRAVRLRVDRRKPRVLLRRRGRAVSVRVSDSSSGLRRGAVRISFGDGARSRRSGARHVYRRGGRYLVTVTARDKAGHRLRWRRRVGVR